jgi:hypothetical protein
MAFLRRFCQIASCFLFFGFRNNHFLLQNRVSLASSVPVFMFLRKRVAQLYPQAPGSLWIAFYDSQGCGGDILTRLHMGTDKHSGSQINSEFSVLIQFSQQNIMWNKGSKCGMLQAPACGNMFLNPTYVSVRDVVP